MKLLLTAISSVFIQQLPSISKYDFLKVGSSYGGTSGGAAVSSHIPALTTICQLGSVPVWCVVIVYSLL